MHASATTKAEARYEAALRAAFEELAVSRKHWEEAPASRDDRMRIESQLSELILGLAARLSPPRRAAYEPQLAELRRPRAYRAKAVHETLIGLLQKEPGRTWSTDDIEAALSRQGVGAERKAINNCLNYFVRTRRLRPMGRGLYYVPEHGTGVVTSDPLPTFDIPKGSENEA